jgi:predicted kinase
MMELGIDLWDKERRTKIEEIQGALTRELLAVGGTVVIEWGAWGRSDREALRLEARELGAAVELHYLSAPVAVLFERVRMREMEKPPMTLDQLVRWSQEFEAPTPEEAAQYDRFIVPEQRSGRGEDDQIDS